MSLGWIFGFALGLLGIISRFVIIYPISGWSFYFLMTGFIIIVISSGIHK